MFDVHIHITIAQNFIHYHFLFFGVMIVFFIARGKYGNSGKWSFSLSVVISCGFDLQSVSIKLLFSSLKLSCKFPCASGFCAMEPVDIVALAEACSHGMVIFGARLDIKSASLEK